MVQPHLRITGTRLVAGQGRLVQGRGTFPAIFVSPSLKLLA